MPSFSEREQAFEAKFAHDEEFRFLATARRDKLFANWVVEGSNLNGPARAAVLAAVLKVADGARHDDMLIELVGRTLSSHGKSEGREALVQALRDCELQARQQLMAKPD